MLDDHESHPGDPIHSSRVILMVIKDAKTGSLLLNAVKRKHNYHVILVSHVYEAFKVLLEVQPDLLVFDDSLLDEGGFGLYHQFHSINGLERVPILLSNLSARFSSLVHLNNASWREDKKPSELECFLYAIQELV